MNGTKWSRMVGRCALAGACVLGLNASMAAESLPREVSIRNVEFVLVPEGPFYRHAGLSSEAEGRGPMVQKHLNAFYMAKYEARARDLVPYMNEVKPAASLYAGDHESCSMRKGRSGAYELVSPRDDLPATHMSWSLADAWARWMGFRLPTESEWEKAARGTDQRMYPWGNQEPDETYANFMTQSSCLVWPVDRASKGKSPYGVFNMAGNIREYVADWHDGDKDAGRVDYLRFLAENAQRDGTPAPKGAVHLLKGGRWASSPLHLEISHRLGWRDDDEAFQCNGTRFAVDVSVVKEHLAKGSAKVLVP